MSSQMWNIIAQEYLRLCREQDAIEDRRRQGGLEPGDGIRSLELQMERDAALRALSATKEDQAAWQQRVAKKA